MSPVALVETWSARAAAPFARLSPAFILWLAIGSLTAIFAIFGVTLYAARHDVRDAAWTASTNLLAAVSQRIDREIEVLDMSLLDLTEGAERPDFMQLLPLIRQAVLFDRAGWASGLGTLMLLDASGRLVEQAGVPHPPALDMSSQPFFTVHRDRELGLYISHPFVSLIDGESSIALSRRVVRSGVFAGVAVATIRLSHFMDIYSQLDLGASGTMSLIAADGTMLVRRPFRLNAVGALVPSAVMPREAAGSFEANSTFDHIRRQFFYQRIGQLPLIQFLGRSPADVYALWWIRTALTGFAMFLLGNTILVLILTLYGELKRRQAAEAALAVLATTDKLTGLANRRKFDEVLEAEWMRARVNRQPVALLMIDVDHFKALNDHIGHQGGDAVLAAIGASLRAAPIAPTGLIARYGGEEFAVLLPGLDLGAAIAAAETMRRVIAELGQIHPARGGRLTVSLGVAVATPSATSAPAELIEVADRALYDAKAAGRDCVRPARVAQLAA